MKTTVRLCCIVIASCALAGESWGYYEGASGNDAYFGYNAGLSNSTGIDNTFIGTYAGTNNQSGTANTFVGSAAGLENSAGGYNTFLGMLSGASNVSGAGNTFLGDYAGYSNQTGNTSVFIGNGAGYGETQSNRLYIDNCPGGSPCTNTPLIYGEFDSHLLNINGVTSVAANGVPKSQMHFSLDNGDYGGFLTSVLPNNFFVSSGARFDSPNWVQRSADGRAVAAGSGSVGYRIFTSTGHAVGETFDISSSVRLFINYNGEFGINGAPVAGHEIHTSSGAYLAGGTWTDASSRELKDNIVSLTSEDAAKALAELNPVRYNYKVTPDEGHVGFIAEDVPELVAMKDRKGLSPMDIVAVLTKAVQEQKQQLVAQDQKLQAERARGDSMEGRLQMLAAEMARLQARVPQ
jgi:hypothetical protein